MGLFDVFKKKDCEICGKEVGMFGYKKLEDGEICKDCVKLLSPWFDDRRHSTVAQIKQQLETAALELLPGLTEIKPKKETLWERLFQKEEPFLMDGADSSTLSFDWETENGIVTVSYNWKHDDPKAQQLIDLLYALQENSKGE